MYYIQTKNKISPIGLNEFSKSYTIQDEIENPDAIILRSASLHDVDFSDKTKAIARAGAGVNNIPIDKCTEKGIVVFNTPGANANAVKELVICSLFLASRKIVDGINWEKELIGKGEEVGKLVEKGKGTFAGNEIYGKTLGVIGLGAIGKLVANAAAALGMNILGYDNFAKIEETDKIKQVTSIDELLSNSDFITLHIPYLPETKDFINSENIANMKNGVKILNFARGELVNEKAIIDAVQNGKVSSYITDFATDLELQENNIICIPHLGASTEESEDNCAKMAASELIDYLENGNVTNSVNFPSLKVEKTGLHRVCVLSKSNVLSDVSDLLSKYEITSITTKEKKGNFYLIADINEFPNETAINLLSSITNILKINIL